MIFDHYNFLCIEKEWPTARVKSVYMITIAILASVAIIWLFFYAVSWCKGVDYPNPFVLGRFYINFYVQFSTQVHTLMK